MRYKKGKRKVQGVPQSQTAALLKSYIIYKISEMLYKIFYIGYKISYLLKRISHLFNQIKYLI